MNLSYRNLNLPYRSQRKTCFLVAENRRFFHSWAKMWVSTAFSSPQTANILDNTQRGPNLRPAVRLLFNAVTSFFYIVSELPSRQRKPFLQNTHYGMFLFESCPLTSFKYFLRQVFQILGFNRYIDTMEVLIFNHIKTIKKWN